MRALPAEFFGVSCSPADGCTVVGYYFGKAGPVAFAEWWDGTPVASSGHPQPRYLGKLFGVSCPSPAACTAAGDYAPGPAAFAETWNGTRWRVQATPAPAGTRVN